MAPKKASQLALDAIAGPDQAEDAKPRRKAEPKTTQAAEAKPTGAAIPGMPAPGKVIAIDIRDMSAWRQKNNARVERFERRGKDVIGWVAEVQDER